MSIPENPQPLTPAKKIAAARYKLDEADRRLTRARVEMEEALRARNEAHAIYLSVLEWNNGRTN
jgi:hypothetical protein